LKVHFVHAFDDTLLVSSRSPMNTPPLDLDEREILVALRSGWEFEAVSVEYEALGFGSHHSVAYDSVGSKRFVTVDDLSKVGGASSNEAGFACLTAAFETARALREAGFRDRHETTADTAKSWKNLEH
jgi:hypothetical protein